MVTKNRLLPRDIFKMLKVKYKTKAVVNLGASLLYPLANHPLALCVPGGAPRKCGKRKLFDAALKDLHLIDGKTINYLEKKHCRHTS